MAAVSSMVPARSALNDDHCVTASAQVEDGAAQRGVVVQRASIDSEHEVTDLQPDACGAAALADPVDDEAALRVGFECHSDQFVDHLRDDLVRNLLQLD